FIICSNSDSTITSGMSTCALSVALLSNVSRVSFSCSCSCCFCRSSFLFAFNSSSVSTSSSISLANSSSNSGSSFSLISWIFTLKTASLPAKSSAWYSSGKVISTSNSSPADFPINCSSNPGINCPEPISREWFSPLPPSNGSSSTKPSKSITAVLPSSTCPSSFNTSSACFSLSDFISSFTSSFLMFSSFFFTFISLFLLTFFSLIVYYLSLISREWFSPSPPSNRSSSTKPSKSITAVLPSSTCPSSFNTSSACFSRSDSSASFTSSSVMFTSCSSTSSPLYSPKVTSGFTVTVAVNTSGFS